MCFHDAVSEMLYKKWSSLFIVKKLYPDRVKDTEGHACIKTTKIPNFMDQS